MLCTSQLKQPLLPSTAVAGSLSHIAAFGRFPTIMPSTGDLGSSPPAAHAPKEDSLVWYKAQYEQLESELADFQESSRELEAELEKDVEAAEKRERHLQEKVEALGYEVEEWKVRTLSCPSPLISAFASTDRLAQNH